MHRYLDFQAASSGLAVGIEFDDLPPFNQGKVVSELMTRLFDQLDEYERRATVHEWKYFGYATTLLMGKDPKGALDRVQEASRKQDVDYPGGGHADQLREALNCAIDVLRN